MTTSLALGAAEEAATASAVRRCLLVVLFASIFLQRFALQPADGIALNFFVTLGALAALGVRGALIVDVMRAALLCGFAACVMLSRNFFLC